MMLRDHARGVRNLVKEEGLASFVVKSPLYLSRILYRHQEYHIWRSDLRDLSGSSVPRTEDYDLKVISKPEEFDKLLAEGLTIDSSFSVKDARRMLAGHLVGFLIFVHGELAWWGWAAMEDRTRYFVYRPPRKVDYTREAYVGRALTLPRHRGLGLNIYGSLKRLEYLKEKGKEGVVLVTAKDNEPAIRTQRRLGSSVCGQIDHFRVVLLWDFWTEEWYDGR